MKPNCLLIKCALLLVAIFALDSQLSTLSALGTAFTVQGRLNNNGTPANGTYDLRLTMYSAASGGTLIAGPITLTGVSVDNGVFSVTPDFGPGVFTGAARYLELGFTPTGGGTFTTLPERQPILAAPYAIFAGTAADVASGSVVKSLNGLKDNVGLAAGANVTLSTNGNTLTIASTGGAGVWSLTGGTAYYNGNVRVGPSNSTVNSKFPISTPHPFSSGQDYGFEHTDGIVRLITYLDGGAAWVGTASPHPVVLCTDCDHGGTAGVILDTAGNLVVRGNLKFSSSPQLFSNGSAENLRTVRGTAHNIVNSSGTGWSASWTAAGFLNLTFDPPFADNPTVVATAKVGGGKLVVTLVGLDSSGAGLNISDPSTNESAFAEVCFIAIGPR